MKPSGGAPGYQWVVLKPSRPGRHSVGTIVAQLVALEHPRSGKPSSAV